MRRVHDYKVHTDPETGRHTMVLSVRDGEQTSEHEEQIDGDWLAHALPDTDDAPVAFSSGREYTFAPELLEGLRRQRRTLLKGMAGGGQQVAG